MPETPFANPEIQAEAETLEGHLRGAEAREAAKHEDRHWRARWSAWMSMRTRRWSGRRRTPSSFDRLRMRVTETRTKSSS
ncbi:MAG: hypothetical protein ACXW3D_05995 [Caulobacteraceae bacterium]